MPTLNPVGHQSTNWIVVLFLIVVIAWFTSFGTTSPRYSTQAAMYFPSRGSMFSVRFSGSKIWFVRSATLMFELWVPTGIRGLYEHGMKCMFG